MPDLPSRWSLTDTLLAPTSEVADTAAWRAAVDDMPARLAALAARGPGGGPLRLTDHDIRLALAPAGGWRESSPFAWSARTARRSLGLSAVRALVAGTVRSPSEGVRAAVAQATRGVRAEQRPASSLDRWVAELAPAGRAAVGAEAVTWATRLWCALDWNAFATPPVIGQDHWWDSPHSSLLALRSRAEVRTGPAHLVLLSGPRRDSVRAELSVVALVASLRSRGESVPGRVVGWWPDSGHLVRVEVDLSVLEAGVGAVAQALAGGQHRVAA
jgi:hypothetical protein